MTLTEFAGKSGGKYNTVWRKAKRIFPAEVWTAETELTAEHIRVLSGKASGKTSGKRPADVPADVPAKQVSVNQPEQAVSVPPARQNFKWPAFKFPTAYQFRRFSFNSVCLLIIIGHAGLIWYDCADLWQEVGQIGGGLAFLFILGCVLLATDSSRVRTSATALWIVAGIDLAAWWVHYPVFTRQMTNYDTGVETKVLCGAICALSFFAFMLYRDEKID